MSGSEATCRGSPCAANTESVGQTGYKWVHRYQQLGCCAHALTDLSRMPHNHPWATDQELVDWVIRAEKLWPNGGPVTLHQWPKRLIPPLGAGDLPDVCQRGPLVAVDVSTASACAL